MKVVGLSYQNFEKAIKQADPDLNFNLTSGAYDGSTPLEGYLFYKQASKTAFKATKGGEALHKPCVHKVHEVCCFVLDAGATAIWAEKLKYSKPVGGLHFNKLLEKFSLKGLGCNCPGATKGNVAKAPYGVGGKLNDKGIEWTELDGSKLTIESLKSIPDVAPVPVKAGGSIPVAPAQPKPKPQTWAPKTTKLGTIILDEPAPKVEAPKAPKLGQALDAKPHEAPVVAGGEKAGQPTGTRDVEAAITGLYILQEIGLAVEDFIRKTSESYLAGSGWGSSIGRHEVFKTLTDRELTLKTVEFALKEQEAYDKYLFIRGFLTFKAEYEARLARNLFDFCVIASCGEARHQHNLVWDGGNPSGRSSAYSRATQFDPRTTLPVLERVFNELPWSGGYGGPLWGNIAKSAGYYFKFAEYPVVFADHCVDLAHNGGLAFNKGLIFNNPHSHSRYMSMLDTKRAGSLLQSTLDLQLPYPKEGDADFNVPNIIGRAVSYGLIPQPKAKLKSWVADPKIATVKWGTNPFKLEVQNGVSIGAHNTAHHPGKLKASKDPAVKAKPAVAVENWQSKLETFPADRREEVKKG